jgi:hypothetical protein
MNILYNKYRDFEPHEHGITGNTVTPNRFAPQNTITSRAALRVNVTDAL